MTEGTLEAISPKISLRTRTDQTSLMGWGLQALQIVADFVTVLAAFAAGYATYGALGFTFDSRPYEFYGQISLVAGVVVVLVYERLGLYRPQSSVLNIEEIRGVNRGVLLSSTVLLALSFYFRDASGHEMSRLILTFSFGWLLLLSNVMRLFLHQVQDLLHRRGVGCRRVLVCGTGELAKTLLRRLTGSPQLGLVPVGLLGEDGAKVGEEFQGQTGQDHTRVRVVGELSKLDGWIRDLRVDEVFLACPDITLEKAQQIHDVCAEEGVVFRFVPQLMGMLFQDLELELFDGIPVMRRRGFRDRPLYEAMKRLFDIGFSSAALLASLPVFAVTAALIRRDTEGPIFFTQDRVGKDGKTFRIYKFRTMYVETPVYEFHPKSGEDPRLTPVGRWLRRLSLDELPQFFNVLLGDMSVVGPRPEMPFIVEKYTPLQRSRLQVKPGITGLWQISADRSRMIHENMDYDIFYVHNRGFLLDLIIVFETCFMVLRGVGAH